MNSSRLHSLRNIAAALLACAGCFASCSQDELAEQGTPLPIGQYPLELAAGGLQAVATPAQPATRGTMDGDWDKVTKVKVRVDDQEEKVYKVEASEDKKTAFLTPAVPLTNDDVLFWWTSTTETKTVMAWAPSGYVLDKEFTLPTEWTENDFAQYDIIGVRKDIGFEDRNKSLEFQHLMAKVVINLRRTDYLEKAKDVNVQLLIMQNTGKLEVNNNNNLIRIGNIYDNKSTTPYRLPPGNYGEVDFGNGSEKPFASYMALVIPSNSSNTDVLQIDVDGATYLVKRQDITNSLNVYYRPGQVTTFNITVKENELDVTIDNTASIGWDTASGNSSNGNVELP